MKAVRNVGMKHAFKGEAKELLGPLQRVTMLGVHAFCAVTAVQAIFNLTIVLLRQYAHAYTANLNPKEKLYGNGWERFFQTHDGLIERLETMFFGMGFISSMVALKNIVSFEKNMHRWLHGRKKTV